MARYLKRGMDASAIKAADANTVFAGGQGLYEIEARQLKYRPVPDPLLQRQIVNALLVDGDDVWAGTYNGLVRYRRTAWHLRIA